MTKAEMASQNKRLQDCLLEFAAIHILPSTQEQHETLEEELLFDRVEPLLKEILGYSPLEAFRLQFKEENHD